MSPHVTSQGLILLDTGTEQMLPGLRSNIEKLGYTRPFIDPDGYQRFVERAEARYLRQLAEERRNSN